MLMTPLDLDEAFLQKQIDARGLQEAWQRIRTV